MKSFCFVGPAATRRTEVKLSENWPETSLQDCLTLLYSSELPNPPPLAGIAFRRFQYHVSPHLEGGCCCEFKLLPSCSMNEQPELDTKVR